MRSPSFNADESNQAKQPKLYQKIQALDYYNYQKNHNKKHRQAETVEYFKKRNEFAISKSAFSRWVTLEPKLRNNFQDLAGGSTTISRSRITNARGEKQFKQHLKDRKEVLKCLEIYYAQTLLLEQDKKITNQDVQKMFKKFSFMIKGTEAPTFDSDAENSFSARNENEDEDWSALFIKSMMPHWESIKERISDLKSIGETTNSLIAEKARILKEIGDTPFEDVYHFQEIILDVTNLCELLESDSEDLQEMLDRNKDESDFLTGDLRQHKTVTISVCGNITGKYFLKPMIVSNLPGKWNQLQSKNSGLQQSPEGLITPMDFKKYMNDLNIELLSKGHYIKIILDDWWPHLGSVKEFTNIKFIHVNPTFDKTVSSFNRTSLVMPFEMGFERLIKLHLKMQMFKFLLKNRRYYESNHMLLEYCSHVVLCNLKDKLEDIFTQITTNKIYHTFYHLNIVASRIFSVQSQHQTSNEFVLKKGIKLSTAVNSRIPEDYRGSIKFLDKVSQLALRSVEEELKSFLKQTVNQLYEISEEEACYSSIMNALLQEFAVGRNESKFNKSYSDRAIVNFVSLDNKSASELHSLILNDISEQQMDRTLLEVVQPYLSKTHNLHETRSKTLKLFNAFYESYINDTTFTVNREVTNQVASSQPRFSTSATPPSIMNFKKHRNGDGSTVALRQNKRKVTSAFKSSFSDDETDLSLHENFN